MALPVLVLLQLKLAISFMVESNNTFRKGILANSRPNSLGMKFCSDIKKTAFVNHLNLDYVYFSQLFIARKSKQRKFLRNSSFSHFNSLYWCFCIFVVKCAVLSWYSVSLCDVTQYMTVKILTLTFDSNPCGYHNKMLYFYASFSVKKTHKKYHLNECIPSLFLISFHVYVWCHHKGLSCILTVWLLLKQETILAGEYRPLCILLRIPPSTPPPSPLVPTLLCWSHPPSLPLCFLMKRPLSVCRLISSPPCHTYVPFEQHYVLLTTSRHQ